MAISNEPLGYCTNVHPGQTVTDVLDGLDRFTVPVQHRLGRAVAAGLWLAQPVIAELRSTADGPRKFSDELRRRDLSCYTLNAFPYGDFHSERVKEKVYQPDWTTAERLAYTSDCAAVLAELMEAHSEGSISTLPLGFKALSQSAEFEARCVERLLECARFLDALRGRTGKVVRLAIEPEPLCVLETTDEAIGFFAQLFEAAKRVGINEIVRRHVGVCYDICHQAVEFEEPAQCVSALQRAGVRINKVHVSCALQLDRPAENAQGREALQKFVEPQYLHQVVARSGDGAIHRLADLNRNFIEQPPAGFREAAAWRIHFHVPINAAEMGSLGTTQRAIAAALEAIAGLPYAPHLEVETYTWNVLPGQKVELVEGLAGELRKASDMVGCL